MQSETQVYQGQANELIQSRFEAGGTIRFVVPTASMFPLLTVGEGIIVRGVRGGEIRAGDLVVSQIGPVWRVHRLIALRKRDGTLWMVTKGDNSRCADAPCPVPDYLGLVVAVCTARGAQDSTNVVVRAIGRGIAELSKWQNRFQARGLWGVWLFNFSIYFADRALRGLLSCFPFVPPPSDAAPY